MWACLGYLDRFQECIIHDIWFAQFLNLFYWGCLFDDSFYHVIHVLVRDRFLFSDRVILFFCFWYLGNFLGLIKFFYCVLIKIEVYRFLLFLLSGLFNLMFLGLNLFTLIIFLLICLCLFSILHKSIYNLLLPLLVIFLWFLFLLILSFWYGQLSFFRLGFLKGWILF